MINGLIFDVCDPEILEMQRPFKEKLWEFNHLKPSEADKKEAYMKEVFAEFGDHCYIELPFHASWGGAHVHFGTGIYVNSNVTMIDDGHIYIGNRVLIGPNAVIATANHPLEPTLRRYEMQFNRDIHIGENSWIGAGVIIVPGVTIGKNTVIGAGAVVTRDIPDNVLAVGAPAHIIKDIGDHKRLFHNHHHEQNNWEYLFEMCEKKRWDPKFH